MKRLASAAAVAALSGSVNAASQYVLDKTYDSGNFFSEFTFSTATDLSNGFVNYQSQADAVDFAYITGDNTVHLGVDSVNHYATDGSDGTGRKSFRIEGTDTFTHGLFVADFAYLPNPACGAWPAL